jgi:enoyl-[acyl-carrier protein] reductase I
MGCAWGLIFFEEQQTMIMKGKKGLIVGLANNRSIAFGIAKACAEEGAELGFTYFQRQKRVEPIAREFGSDKIYKLDITDEEDMQAIAGKIERDFGKIDFLVHSAAYTPKETLSEPFMTTTKEAFDIAMNTSVYSLIDLTNRLESVLSDKASILTLSYLGGPKYIPNYNVMGIAKAALEATVRYMAVDLGVKGQRVNAISAGPIKTLAASGIGDFSQIMKWSEVNSPLKKIVSIDEVGKSAMYLLSDLSSGVTGEVHYVDAGYNIMGMASVEKNAEGKTVLSWDNYKA